MFQVGLNMNKTKAATAEARQESAGSDLLKSLVDNNKCKLDNLVRTSVSEIFNDDEISHKAIWHKSK